MRRVCEVGYGEEDEADYFRELGIVDAVPGVVVGVVVVVKAGLEFDLRDVQGGEPEVVAARP